jgi:signal transduction histidine kinase
MKALYMSQQNGEPPLKVRMGAKRIPTGQLFGTRPLNQVVSHTAFPEISPRLQAVLQQIVTDVVSRLGCVGAMVTTLERGNALPVRAYSMRFAPALLEKLEKEAGVSLIGPRACTYLDDPRYRENLSVRAVLDRNRRPDPFLVSDRLADLFAPVVSHEFADDAQKMTGIRQIIALPFFIDGEAVGNLFAATRDAFSQRDIDFLTAFGQQAANAVQAQRQLDQTQALERVVLELQSQISDETRILQVTVDALVDKLGYVGALVSTLEADNTLPLRAMAFDMPPDVVKSIEKKTRHTLTEYQQMARLDDTAFQANIGYRALNRTDGEVRNRFVESDHLFDLFRPALDKSLSRQIQELLGVKRVIAVPFFMNDVPIGNMYVMTRNSGFSEQDRAVLTAFAQQAAVGIRNARLYRRAEEQRLIAQALARMAFSASAYVHTLRNHIGAIGNYLMLSNQASQMTPARQLQLADIREKVMDLVNQSADILDNLHEPWRQKSDVATNLNQCIYDAVNKLFPNLQVDGETHVDTQIGIVIEFELEDSLPQLKTAPEMLTEVFSILLSNAVTAVAESAHAGLVRFQTRRLDNGMIAATVIDNGVGIAAANIPLIFEMGWTTRDDGMGFGLFWLKDYVNGLGGDVAVQSTPDAGTVFTVQLPFPSA